MSFFADNNLWNLPRNFNNTALLCAVMKGFIEPVRLLLTQKNIDINIKAIFN